MFCWIILHCKRTNCTSLWEKPGDTSFFASCILISVWRSWTTWSNHRGWWTIIQLPGISCWRTQASKTPPSIFFGLWGEISQSRTFSTNYFIFGLLATKESLLDWPPHVLLYIYIFICHLIWSIIVVIWYCWFYWIFPVHTAATRLTIQQKDWKPRYSQHPLEYFILCGKRECIQYKNLVCSIISKLLWRQLNYDSLCPTTASYATAQIW